MIIKQIEAGKFLCPVTRGNEAMCQGAKCMAWRWEQGQRWGRVYPEHPLHHKVEPPRPDNVPASWEWVSSDDADDGRAFWIEDDESSNVNRKGFCGLAGMPASE